MKTILFILFSLSVTVSIAQDKMIILPNGSTIPQWVPVSTIAGGAREWEFNVVDYGAVGDGTTDDTAEFQDAIDAAILYDGGVLIIPKAPTNWTITSTLNVVPASGETCRMNVWATGDRDDISYEGANSTALFSVQGLYDSHWEGISAIILSGRTGCVLIDIDTDAGQPRTQFNTFKNMYLSLGGDDDAGTAAGRNEDCIGIRTGLVGGGAGHISNYTFENVNVFGGNDASEPTSAILGQYAFQNLSGLCYGMTWLGGHVENCERAYSNVDRAGTNGGQGSAFFYGFGASNNSIDFTFTVEHPYIISGGRFQYGDRFLQVTNDPGLANITIENCIVLGYADDNNMIDIGAAASVVIDNVQFNEGAASTYTSIISLTSNGNFGSLTIKNSSFSLSTGSTYPYVISGSTSWQIDLRGNMRQRSDVFYVYTGSHFRNSNTTPELIENIAPEVRVTGPLFSMNNTTAGVSEIRWLEDSDNGSNYVGLTVNSTLAGNTTYTLPTAFPAGNGYSLTSTTGGVMSWTNITGITNSAINTELMKSNGTNAIGSDVIIPSTANVNLGKGTTSGTSRVVTATGSGANIKLDLRGQGTGGVQIVPDSASTNSLALFNKPIAGGGGTGLQVTTDADPSGGAVIMFDFRGTTGNDDILQLQFLADSVGLSGGTLLGGTTSKPLVIAGQAAVSSKPGSHLVIHGGDSGSATLPGNTYLRGGANTGGNGGNLVLSPGEGSGTNGYIIIQNLPTSSAGLPSGALWLNSNVLTRVP